MDSGPADTTYITQTPTHPYICTHTPLHTHTHTHTQRESKSNEVVNKKVEGVEI